MLEERHSSLIAQIFWLGFRQLIGYERQERMREVRMDAAQEDQLPDGQRVCLHRPADPHAHPASAEPRFWPPSSALIVRTTPAG